MSEPSVRTSFQVCSRIRLPASLFFRPRNGSKAATSTWSYWSESAPLQATVNLMTAPREKLTQVSGVPNCGATVVLSAACCVWLRWPVCSFSASRQLAPCPSTSGARLDQDRTSASSSVPFDVGPLRMRQALETFCRFRLKRKLGGKRQNCFGLMKRRKSLRAWPACQRQWTMVTWQTGACRSTCYLTLNTWALRLQSSHTDSAW
jgi:hypothetical protein